MARAPDFSLPIQHLLQLRCILLKVKPVLIRLATVGSCFSGVVVQEQELRMWEQLEQLRHHGIQSLLEPEQELLQEPAIREMLTFLRLVQSRSSQC